MSKIDTDKIREEYRTRHKDREWFEVWLQEALDEIDRLRDGPLLSDGEFNETQMKREVEQQTKDAVRDSILENCEPKTEYGPRGQHTEWYTADDIEQAIGSVGAGE